MSLKNPRFGLLGPFLAVFTLAACRAGEVQPAASQAATPAQDAPRATATPAAKPEPAEPQMPANAILDDGIRSAREAAQRRMLKKDQELQPDLAPLPPGPLPGADLPADSFPGFFSGLEISDGQDPLANFHAALAELEAGTREAPVRLAFYGASGTAADLWTGYVRAYLQARFGDAGPGMVGAARPTRWYRHNELIVKTSKKHWTKHNSYRLEDGAPPTSFGVMGFSMSAEHKFAWTEIHPGKRSSSARKVTGYEVFHLEQKGGGGYRIRVDGKVVAKVKTKLAKGASGPRLGREKIEVEPGEHVIRLEVDGKGPVHMLGVSAEIAGEPGLILDTLGVDGSKASNQLRWYEPVWTEHLRARDPELYVLAYGTNESVDEDETAAQYERELRAVLERYQRAVPDASCVLLGPGDFPKVEDGVLLPRPRLNEIREIQRKLAPEFGCAFWDALKFVGGEGAKAAWVEAGLARDDYLHLTRAGYVRLGIGFSDALMQAYDWKRRQNQDAPSDAAQ